jgi:aspartate carbamoyltransferase catalytic subunit
MKMSNWLGRDVISILDFTRNDLEILFEEAELMLNRLKEGNVPKLLSDKVIALAFFEPSTRTRMSFETAAKRLGASTISFTAEEAISVSKGESFADTIRMLDNYSDLIVLRHRFEGAALFAAEIAQAPIINGGDGKQHHPTQAMLDLFTIRKLKGSIKDLVIGVLGDLKYGRAASSFILGLTIFKPKRVYLISPPELRVRPEIKEILWERGLIFEEVESLTKVLPELDILYVTRIQKERFPDPREYEKVKGSYRITSKLLYSYAKKDLKVLHPLPRVDEITYDVDDTPFASYFLQARLGVPLRMALLKLILKGEG